MTRKTRIIAIENDAPEGTPIHDTTVAEEANLADSEAESDEAGENLNQRSLGTFLAAIATVAAITAWTGAFVLANITEMRLGGSLQLWTAWLRDWAVPVLLVAVIWLIAMRNSNREAVRFGRTAHMLNAESERLENRLSIVNRELSLAREFIASQARDIESLGRVATERLSQHADRLAALIADNSNRLDSIQTVSEAALENMERLRSNLPVIASSAKDVTNNIGTAGRSANAQIEDLVNGFNRLHEIGQSSERQVANLKLVVDQALSEFTQQTDQLGEIAEQRFATLAERGAEFRTQLESHEVEVLAAIRSRATALAEELEAARQILDVQESESLTSLRARLTAIRDESGALVRSLRDGESNALQSWKIAIVQLEDDLTRAIARVAEIDQKAMSSAQARLADLAGEAAQLDERMAERDQQFTAELEKRQQEFEARHAEFIARLSGQLENLDAQIVERQAAQEQHGRELVSQSELVVQQFEQLAQRLDEISALGGQAEDKVAQGLIRLTENLAASRQALDGTDRAIADLTDSSVRLLELIQASVQHSSNDLPQAMEISEAKLATVESRVSALRQELADAEQSGQRLTADVDRGSETLGTAIGQVEMLSAQLEAGGARQSETLETMARSLERVRSESLDLAEQAQEQLRKAIEGLERSAQDVAQSIETIGSGSVAQVAARLGDESAAAIDRVMRERAQEVAGQLEKVAASAAGVSREAAMHLRDQLAKVSELTAHLEQRVAHARNRAEEQVDNDFARRVALITESLNSNAIDIARVIDSDVSDTAWSAYLKGDRGIFTRRAVRLLDSSEVKTIAGLYEEDRPFREHVSRYIHDFEAMLRQLLSTRDGHALGVTLLSSDMGKLYVALAQAIERLRN
jgi:chromosome segregation ATPase